MITKILSVGGSIIAPEKPDVDFLRQFVAMARAWISAENDRRLIFVAGGGAPARVYQHAYREVLADTGMSQCGAAQSSGARRSDAAQDSGVVNAGSALQADSDAADWIGIMATRLNAQLLKACCGSLCTDDVVYNPTGDVSFTGKILVASGWKPGFSTDNDAVLLAEKFSADTVVNLSNIEKVYTDDPRKNPDAKPLDGISWNDFRVMVGDEWTPGKNTPFDPVASKKAEQLGLTVICASGKNIENIRAILDEKEFVGTKIGG
ncbi:MAG: UMP kinase [Treponema sp.]|nr:UMP kinase [Treponema sp.]